MDAENKSEMIFARVSNELAERLEAFVERMPGTKSEHVRIAIERYVTEEERKLAMLAKIL